MTMPEIRILVVEDEPIIVEDICDYLNNIDFKVSGIAYDSNTALHELRSNTPDMVLLDIELRSKLDGIAIAHIINKKYQIPFVFLTSFADRHTIQRVRDTFPAGYIVKPFDEKDLYTTLEIGYYNHAQRLANKRSKLNINLINQNIPNPLTQREFEVLELIMAGKTNKQISDDLFVSTNTIKTHISNVYLKLDANSRTQAIAKTHEILKSV